MNFKKLKKFRKSIIVLIIFILYFLTLFILKLESFEVKKIDIPRLIDQDLNYSYIEKDGIKILDLKEGIPYMKGYFHGESLKNEIRELLVFFKNDFLGNDRIYGGPIYSILNYKAKNFVEFIPKEYLEEMKGIADGAGVDFNDILLINTFDDIMNLSGCSSMVLPKQDGFSDIFYHTRNLDYNLPILAKHKIVFKYDTHISVGFPGFIGVLTGVGEKGISLSSHTSYTNEEPSYGIPTGLLYRKIIEESGNIDEVKYIIENADRTIANNIVLGSYKENKGLVAEVTSTRVGYREQTLEKNAIVSTNYFKSKEMKEDDKLFGIDRYNQYFDKLRSIEKIDYNEIKNIVSYFDPDIRGWGTIANRGTIQSVIMQPKLRKIFVANGKKLPVTQGEFIEINY